MEKLELAKRQGKTIQILENFDPKKAFYTEQQIRNTTKDLQDFKQIITSQISQCPFI